MFLYTYLHIYTKIEAKNHDCTLVVLLYTDPISLYIRDGLLPHSTDSE